MDKFYVVSNLQKDSSLNSDLNIFKFEDEAIEHAMEIMHKRLSQGKIPIDYYVLEAKTVLALEITPIKVSKLE